MKLPTSRTRTPARAPSDMFLHAPAHQARKVLAESEGFEPPIPFRVLLISSQVPSAARPALQNSLARSSTALAERVGFEPTIRFRIHAFQACAFGRSATSPCSLTSSAREKNLSTARCIPLPALLCPLERDDSVADRGGCRRARSEERRVGKECRSRWSPYH